MYVYNRPEKRKTMHTCMLTYIYIYIYTYIVVIVEGLGFLDMGAYIRVRFCEKVSVLM